MAKKKGKGGGKRRSSRRGGHKRGHGRKRGGGYGWLKTGLEIGVGLLAGEVIAATGLLPAAAAPGLVGVLAVSVLSNKGRMPNAATLAVATGVQVSYSVSRTDTMSKVKVGVRQAIGAKSGGGGGSKGPNVAGISLPNPGDLDELVQEAQSLQAAGQTAAQLATVLA